MEKRPELGFGIMRMPMYNGEINWDKSKKLIDEYMKGEYCYFDTHPTYMMKQSQIIIRELVVKRYDRKRFLLANKIPYFGINTYDDYHKILMQEFKDCGVDYFDYYLFHALSKENFEMHERLGGFQFLNELKQQKVVKAIGFSFHDTPELLDEILRQHSEVDFVQLQINYFDWNNPIIRSRACYEIARKYKKDIIVMEPIKGGSLARGNCSQKHAEMALQFVKSLPGVKVILSGMSELEHIKANRAVLSQSNDSKKIDLSVYQNLKRDMERQNLIPCTECRYCIEECPKGIKIPDIFSLLNSYHRPGKYDRTFHGRMDRLYKNMILNKGSAGECINCGMCERRCPQKINIRENLKKAANMFEKKYFYTSERNIQILIYLMRVYGIRKIIASPGAKNASFVYSVQQDDYFEVYSAPDERSAAYMACGLAMESGEIVALSCTGATASRNYIPGLTEAYYRNIPILAITSAEQSGRIGHNIPQIIDRSKIQNDIAKLSVELPAIKDGEDEWNCIIQANRVLNELWHKGMGPVHVNLVTTMSQNFSTKTLPHARIIRRIQPGEKMPDIPMGVVGIFCGAHKEWDDNLTSIVDCFCEKYDAVVICDHTSNYTGRFRYTPSFLKGEVREKVLYGIDILIHIGNISGAYFPIKAKEVWRIHPDGEYRDTFRSLSYVFEMDERYFFEMYVKILSKEYKKIKENKWLNIENNFRTEPLNIPFSNAWIASQTANKLPHNSVLHLGILNSLRMWNFYQIPKSVRVYSNTGGFGIDGCLSTLVGASLSNPEKLYFGVIGDLAFFYDMNSLGNHHIGSNIRLLVINNGCGTEFKNYNHSTRILGEQTDLFIAAKGHYGNKSKNLLKNYAENLGFIYASASTKEEYLRVLPGFVTPNSSEKSILIEVFTDSEAESEALRLLNAVIKDKKITEEIYEKEEIKVPDWFNGISEKEVVLWGSGFCFTKNLTKVREICDIRYVCDNNPQKWDIEILPGIKCISPNKLKEMKDIFVVIMVEDANIGFDIAHQLQMMKICHFDMAEKWLKYAQNMIWKDLNGDVKGN